MFKKIKNWFNSLNKQKCPNCKSIELEQLEKKFTHTTQKPYYNHSKFDSPSDRAMQKPTPAGYDEYKIYDVKYQCKDCKFIFNNNIEI